MEIDKQALYGRHEAGEQRHRDRQDQRDGLHLKAAHKALDIAQDEEDMGGDITTTRVTNNNGVSPLVMAGLLVTSVLVSGGSMAYLLTGNPPPVAPIAPVVAPVVSPVTPPPGTDADTKYEFRISSGDPNKE